MHQKQGQQFLPRVFRELQPTLKCFDLLCVTNTFSQINVTCTYFKTPFLTMNDFFFDQSSADYLTKFGELQVAPHVVQHSAHSVARQACALGDCHDCSGLGPARALPVSASSMLSNGSARATRAQTSSAANWRRKWSAWAHVLGGCGSLGQQQTLQASPCRSSPRLGSGAVGGKSATRGVVATAASFQSSSLTGEDAAASDASMTDGAGAGATLVTKPAL